MEASFYAAVDDLTRIKFFGGDYLRIYDFVTILRNARELLEVKERDSIDLLEKAVETSDELGDFVRKRRDAGSIHEREANFTEDVTHQLELIAACPDIPWVSLDAFAVGAAILVRTSVDGTAVAAAEKLEGWRRQRATRQLAEGRKLGVRLRRRFSRRPFLRSPSVQDLDEYAEQDRLVISEVKEEVVDLLAATARARQEGFTKGLLVLA